jgi:hypothetical protein
MRLRDVGFFLVGLGLVFPFAVIGFIDVTMLLRHHMFLFGVVHETALVLLVVPLLPLMAGCFLLYRERKRV